jgi:predicted permease
MTLRVTWRSLARRRGATLLVVSTLAVAIAASTVTYSVVDMLRHLVPDDGSHRLVFVAETDPRPSQSQSGVYNGVAWAGVSIPDLADFANRANTVEQFGAYGNGSATLMGIGHAQRIRLVRATPNLLSMWNVQPMAGRSFLPTDSDEAAPGAALISYRFWREQLDGSQSAIGRQILVDERSYTVVGVLPARLDRSVLIGYDVMVPLGLDPLRAARDERRLFTFAALKPSVTPDQAEADLSAIARQLSTEYPVTNGHTGVVVRPPIQQLGGYLPTLLLLLIGIAIALIAIACANISNVMLAVATGRRQEYAVRAALGASRRQQIMLVLTEGLALSAAACIAGLALAWLGINSLRSLETGAESTFSALALNWRVLAGAVIVAALSPLGFALLPALSAVRSRTAMLNDGRSGDRTSGRHARHALVALQVGLTVVLLVQIGAFARTAWMLMSTPTGFEASRLLTFRLELSSSNYPDAAARTRFIETLLARLSQSTGVTDAAAINRLPIADREESGRLAIAGVDRQPQDEPAITIARITEDYLSAMRIPLTAGRAFLRDDVERARPVAVVSASAARRFWPGGNAVGQRIAISVAGDGRDWLEVIGIAGDVRNSDADQAPAAQVYVPISVSTDTALAVVVRTTTDPVALAGTVRDEVGRLDAVLPVFGLRTMDAVLFGDTAGTVMVMSIMITIAFVALCVAAAGIYGLTAFAVTQRTKEIGVRMALGARPAVVVRMIVAQTGRPVAVGAVLGAGAAIGLASFAAAAITEVDFRNPLDYAGVLLGLGIVALAATGLPARRVTRIDPAIALRTD